MTMTTEIDEKTTPGTVTLTAAILDCWDIPSIIRYCNLASAGVQTWELSCLSKHDLKKKHGIS
jgi:hypothetical protein